jgi:hypothetical protein
MRPNRQPISPHFSVEVGERAAELSSGMAAIVISTPQRITGNASIYRWDARGYAWGAVLIGSELPEILSRAFGIAAGTRLPLSQTIILLGLAFAAAKLRSIKNLAGFIFAIAALQFAWQIAVGDFFSRARSAQSELCS